ncbi:methylated-DNA--[protein]-cysteine S-methyltransferase [Aestuariicoccus sp. MJ-SS9]|uniref:methylated-DNA--[protein]-cysteine S-methyltransferase n=1 Tax=Aestuariicoccus sp. MJ-SS9 TaxID=3079855 RepID=UPI0029074C34|nr:methylated-DNA--[protein]-cysteine S-methyltransferase [Aestuariicoccus sp. MJ-SS9]MDU8911822.1 methylated-DNA--[protein]-cysteine S-methyltransferase [Aestuariicoccus sp. MJ-SS9]
MTGPDRPRRMTVQSPLGPLTITEEEGAITALAWAEGGAEDTPLLRDAAQQLEAYFAGDRTDFELPLRPAGSAFQKQVCAAMAAIPFGDTLTYGEIARALNAPPQAVGQACGGNPIPILIPCHRVLGRNGLGGFSGGTGVETKIWLLKHERAGGLLI